MFIRFLLIGGTGFLIDASITYALVLLNFAPWQARIPAILLAMIFTWLGNRKFTYEVQRAHSTAEALRYAMAAIFMALVNYLIFLALLGFGIWPLVAVIIATACQTILSFHIYRHFVFKDARKHQ